MEMSFLQAIGERIERSFTGTEREKGEEIFNSIRLLTKTVDKKEFFQLLASILESLDDQEGKRFKRYFRRHVMRLETWAPFARSEYLNFDAR